MSITVLACKAKSGPHMMDTYIELMESQELPAHFGEPAKCGLRPPRKCPLELLRLDIEVGTDPFGK